MRIIKTIRRFFGLQSIAEKIKEDYDTHRKISPALWFRAFRRYRSYEELAKDVGISVEEMQKLYSQQVSTVL